MIDFGKRLVLCLACLLPAYAWGQNIAFEEFDTGSATFVPLTFAGYQTGQNGDAINAGPAYTPQSAQFPYVMLDVGRGYLLLHPQTTSGAVVAVQVPADGSYAIKGSFARANDSRNAGDGVRVIVVRNETAQTPLFDASISSDNAVDPQHVFSGTGVASFNLELQLQKGEYLRFVVLSGQNLVDMSFDLTALQFTITSASGQISMPNAFPPALLASGSQLSFFYTVGSGYPLQQSIPISSVPSGLGLAASASTTSGGNWLSASLNASVTPAILRISVDPSTLPTTNDHYYAGSVTITAPGAPGLQIPVALATYAAADGPSGITPYLASTERVQDAISLRYKFRVQTDSGNESTLKILFFGRSFYNPNRTEPYGYYEFETNLYSDWWQYSDTGCENGVQGIYHPSHTGLWVSIPDYPAVDPSFPLAMKGRVGIRPSDLLMFPRQSSGIDGIPLLTKIETISQMDMTGKDVAVQITRGGTFTDDLSNWGYRLDPTRPDNSPSACLPNLPNGFVYRIWHVVVSFDTQSYSWDVAMPNEQALYISPDQLMGINTEFFQTPGSFQVYIWDVSVMGESAAVWQPINRWAVTYQVHSERNTGSGVKLGTYLGNPVIEFSCDRTDTYLRLHDVLDLSAGSSGPVPAISTVQTVGGTTTIAPNTLIHIAGTGLAPDSMGPDGLTWQESPEFASHRMPTSLRGVSVTVGDAPAYILYVNSTDIYALTPLKVATGTTNIVINNGNQSSLPYSVLAQDTAPAFLPWGKSWYIAAERGDGVPLGPPTIEPGLTPARPGQTIALFGTGFGLPSTPLTAGEASQTGTLSILPTVWIGGTEATVTYAGLAAPGLYEVTVVVPTSALDGDNAVIASEGAYAPVAAVFVKR